MQKELNQNHVWHLREAIRYGLLLVLDHRGLRTITTPAKDSARLANVVRSQFQILEDEIADTSTGHDHDGSDSKLMTIGSVTAAGIGNTVSDGASSNATRSNHRHALSSTTPVTQNFSDAASEGTATTFVRSDHRHGMPNVSTESLPSGSIILWDGSGCPTGYTRVSAIDNKFLVSDTTYNASPGGADTITITGSIAAGGGASHTYAHDHDLNSDSTFSDGSNLAKIRTSTSSDGVLFEGSSSGSGSPIRLNQTNTPSQSPTAEATHTHTLSMNSHDNRPAFATVLLCKRN